MRKMRSPKLNRPAVGALVIVVFLMICIYETRKPHAGFGYKHAVNTGEKDLAQEWTNDPIPRRDFRTLAKYPPQNINEPSKYAYATLYCSRTPSPRDPYFQAAQQIIWRLLWSSYRSKHPVVVFVCPFIPQENRRILAGQGAVVKEIGLLDDIIPDTTLPLQRWMDVMSKLNLWAEVEWKRLVFLDLDAFPITNMDELFNTPMQHCNETRLSDEDLAVVEHGKGGDEMCNYIFAGVKQWDSYVVNAGVMLFTPNLDMHARLLRGARRTDEYIAADMEQGVIKASVGFGPDGAFPTHYLGQQWNGFLNYFDQYLEQNLKEKDGELKVIHAKIWNTLLDKHQPMRVIWEQDWMEMCRFYDGDKFEEARNTGVFTPFMM